MVVDIGYCCPIVDKQNLLLDLHMGLTTSYSIMKITAQMMTAASAALGMK